jgi:hypothetical protein
VNLRLSEMQAFRVSQRRDHKPRLVWNSNDFTAADGRECTIGYRVDTIAYESNTSVCQAEIPTTCVSAGKSIVVRPVTDILWNFQYSIERDSTGCGTRIGVVPPIPLAPSRHCLADDKGI